MLQTPEEIRNYLEDQIKYYKHLRWKAFRHGNWFMFGSYRQTVKDLKQQLKELNT